MALPWTIVDRAKTKEGWLELRRRGDDDVLLALDNRILMSSRANRSEIALAEQACNAIVGRKRPRILIGGLGLGYTLRAALDALPDTAQVVVAELNADIARWCATELASLTNDALSDPRVDLRLEDVTHVIARAAAAGRNYDAVLLDLYAGPGPETNFRTDRLYGDPMLTRLKTVLRPGGIFALWAEQLYPTYANHLRRCGFGVEVSRPGRGGLRHAVYVAQLMESAPTPAKPPTNPAKAAPTKELERRRPAAGKRPKRGRA